MSHTHMLNAYIGNMKLYSVQWPKLDKILHNTVQPEVLVDSLKKLKYWNWPILGHSKIKWYKSFTVACLPIFVLSSAMQSVLFPHPLMFRPAPMHASLLCSLDEHLPIVKGLEQSSLRGAFFHVGFICFNYSSKLLSKLLATPLLRCDFWALEKVAKWTVLEKHVAKERN